MPGSRQTRIHWLILVLATSSLASFAVIRHAAADNAPADSPDAALAGQLLEGLRIINRGKECYRAPWLRILKRLVDLGPSAVPELIEELEINDDERMLRSLGFALRAIGDKRAIPALIRAIPRTLLRGGSDYALTCDDPELLKFAQQHQFGQEKTENEYEVCRPVLEVFAALQRLTGQEFDEEEIYDVFLDGLPTQRRLKRQLYLRTARKWADWWEAHWSEFISDKDYSKVNLVVTDEKKQEEDLILENHFATGDDHAGFVLESVFHPAAKCVFYDFDTGRAARLPVKWRQADDIAAHLPEILAWAREEGFDVMGTEYVSPQNDQRVFAIRSIDLNAWELGKDRWKMKINDITLEELLLEGVPVGEWLLHFDPETKSLRPQETATFLFLTREGTPGLLFLGVEVQDDTLKPGGDEVADDELQPIAFFKGRRYAFTEFREIKPQP